MAEATFYEIIGVAPDASHHQIRKAFMRLAEEYQADRKNFPAAGWYFDRAKKAYDKLSDHEARCLYNEERGLPPPPGEVDRRAVGWVDGFATLIPGNWYIFAFIGVALVYLGVRLFAGTGDSAPPLPSPVP